MRHGRERYAPQAEFVWLRRTRVTNDGWVDPGDPVDKSILPPGRLATLWSTGRIALANPPQP